MNGKSKFQNRYTDEELIKILQDFYNKNGKCPVRDDFEKRVPNASTFTSHFGSWDNSLEIAGLLDKKWYKQNYSDEELISLIIDYYNNYHIVPTSIDIKNNNLFPSYNVYHSRFGKYENVLKIAGLFEINKELKKNKKKTNKDNKTNKKIIKRNRKYETKYTDEEMLQLYLDLTKKLGKIPTSKDLNNSINNIPNYKTYMRRFDTIKNVLKLLNIDLMKIKNEISPRFHKTNEELIEELKLLGKELNRIPIKEDLKHYSYLSTDSTYWERFGSWTEALILAGFKPYKTYFRKKKNIKYRSYYEYIFSDTLDELNVIYEHEPLYRDVIKNYNGRMRFDFKISYENKYYYIEIFGMENSIKYKEKTKLKISMCKENDVPLIDLYRKDFYGKSLDELKDVLINKINNIKGGIINDYYMFRQGS